MTTQSKPSTNSPLWNVLSDFSTGIKKAVRFSGLALIFAYIFAGVHPEQAAQYFALAIHALWFGLLLVEERDRMKYDPLQLTVSGGLILFISTAMPLGILTLFNIEAGVLATAFILIVIPVLAGTITMVSWLSKEDAWKISLWCTGIVSVIFGFIVYARVDQTDLSRYETHIAITCAVLYGLIQHFIGWKLADKPETPYRRALGIILDFSNPGFGIVRASILFYALASIAMRKYDLPLFDILSFAGSIVMSTSLVGEYMYRLNRPYKYTAFVSAMFLMLVTAFPATYDTEILYSAWKLFLGIWLAVVCATPWYTQIEGVNDIYARFVGALVFGIIVMLMIFASDPMNERLDPEEIQRMMFIFPFFIVHILFGAITSGNIN